MTDAPQCRAPESCGPFGLPGHPEDESWEGWCWCAACGYLWESGDDYMLAVRAQDEYLALEGVAEAAKRQEERAASDKRALADWEAWAKQHGGASK